MAVMMGMVNSNTRKMYPFVANVKHRIGRKANAYVKLMNPRTAGDHALIEWDGRYTLELMSLDDNTFLDGLQVECGGNKLMFADEVFEVKSYIVQEAGPPAVSVVAHVVDVVTPPPLAETELFHSGSVSDVDVVTPPLATANFHGEEAVTQLPVHEVISGETAETELLEIVEVSSAETTEIELLEIDEAAQTNSGSVSGVDVVTPPQLPQLPQLLTDSIAEIDLLELDSPPDTPDPVDIVESSQTNGGGAGAYKSSMGSAKRMRTSGSAASRGTEVTSCSICLQDLYNNGMRTALCCSHTFHTACVDIWLRRSNVCPLCRTICTLGDYESSEYDSDSGDDPDYTPSTSEL